MHSSSAKEVPLILIFRAQGRIIKTVNLKLAISPSFELLINQEVCVSNIAITLEKIIVSPLESRIWLRTLGQRETGATRLFDKVHLSGKDWDYVLRDGSATGLNGITMFKSLDELYTKDGEWRMTIEDVTIRRMGRSSVDDYEETLIKGSWTYDFIVPPFAR